PLQRRLALAQSSTAPRDRSFDNFSFPLSDGAVPGSPAVAASPTERTESTAGRSTASVGLVDGDQLRAALAPVRRQILELLATPASATEVAAALDISRQRANYHVRALEAAGLVALVEERQRRGCVERVMRATAA